MFNLASVALDDLFSPMDLDADDTRLKFEYSSQAIISTSPPTDASNEDESENEEEDSTRGQATTRIESMMLDIVRQFKRVVSGNSTSSRVSIELANRRKANIDGSIATRTISFPRGSSGRVVASRTFALAVLNAMHKSLVEDIPVTKRDIYYQDVELFGSQNVVDQLIDDISATFSLSRGALNVKATSKGLVCGSGLALVLQDESVMRPTDTEAITIPCAEDIARVEISDDVAWVLVVEKDAVFQTLCALRTSDHSSVQGRGIVVTGKGYPDVATRQLVKLLCDNLPERISILGLFDNDPYGVDILCVYKYGSFSMRHDNNALVAARLIWIGVLGNEFESLGVGREATLSINIHDHNKAIKMLTRPEAIMPKEMRRELMNMLHTRRKAEIEIIGGGNLLLAYVINGIKCYVN